MNLQYHCYFLLSMWIISISARSVHRPKDHITPKIITYWTQQPYYKYELTESHLQEVIFHLYQEEYLSHHLLPTDEIPFRYNLSQSVNGQHLSNLIEQAIDEIKHLKLKRKQKELKHFYILKKRDMNKQGNTGLIILKFKEYPFVVKLFIETPKSFINPFSKGLEPMCFYYMGGGVSRHLTGFTRIKNLELIKQEMAQSPYWSSRIDFPREWFWLPKNSRLITIEGINIGPQKYKRISIPATYAIIADEIVWEKPFTMRSQKDKQTAMKLSNFLQQKIDPHINNYGIEKQSGKIVPIDFEHFPSVVGLGENRQSHGYWAWYSHLACKMLKDRYFRSKQKRRTDQFKAYTSKLS